MIRVILLLFPLSLFAETTDNLLNQTYFDSGKPINGWSGTNDHNHGNSIIAGVHDKYLENTITLGDTLNQSQMNGGWTSTFGSDIWHWNDYQSTVRMTQTITGADGSVTTQVRDVVSSPCGGNNCGSYVTYTDSYTQGINNQSNFNIKVRYDFSDTSQSSSHWSPDVKNPTLTIEHSLLSVEQQSTISEINETIDETIQQQIEIVEFIPIEEFTFEVYEEPVVQMFEEIYIEEIAKEEINIGTVNVFKEIPMEISYEEPKTIETFATEVESFEERIETTESFNQPEERETILEASNSSGVIERESLSEETNRGNETTSVVEEERRGGNEPASGSSEERIVGESNREDSEQNQSVERNTEPEETTSNSEPRTVREESNTNTEELVAENDRQDTPDVSIESITKQVESTTMNVNQKLEQINILVAKAMQSPVSIDSYTTINDNIFNEQLKIDGGNLDEYIQKNYTDSIQISDGNQDLFNDIVVQNQIKIDNAKANVVRSQEHLRRIRGY